MTTSFNNRALVFLGMALAASIVLAFPIDQITHDFQPDPRSSWVAHSCNTIRLELDLGNIAQAVLPPILIFLLPGPGSLLQRRTASWRLSPALLMIAGCAIAGAIAFFWWHGLREYASTRGLCPAVFDLQRPVSAIPPATEDYELDCAVYFIALSGFASLWVGITAAGLRLQSARAAWAGETELRRFQSFFWTCLLTWAVQYRLSQWIFAIFFRESEKWLAVAVTNLVFVTVSCLWALPFIKFLWKRGQWTTRDAVITLFCGSLGIYALTMFSCVWLWYWAINALAIPLLTLNLMGFEWARFIAPRLTSPELKLSSNQPLTTNH
jgi:hypothetical protein